MYETDELSEAESRTSNTNLYEEFLNDENTIDLSSKSLQVVPNIENKLICALYLQNNKLKTLPDDFFPSLENLKWLDLRDNELEQLPSSVQDHRSLTHLLLQNNKLISLPNELGTVSTLKVLQLNGNPLTYPPKEIINAGKAKVLSFLGEKYYEELFKNGRVNDLSEDTISNYTNYNQDGRSYNSVIDGSSKRNKGLSIKFLEKGSDSDDSDSYSKYSGKCPKLASSRSKVASYNQSSKYVRPEYAAGTSEQNERIKRSHLKDMALQKHKDLLASREKILQERKTMQQLQNWRQSYRTQQLTRGPREYTRSFPYDTNPEYMTLLSREVLQRDLPDKYAKRLIRRCRPTVPRKATADLHLAMKIKQLFENLEAIDLNRDTMTPRTEQKMLLGEIQKISEIKQKLMQLSTSNEHSVTLQ